MDTSNVGKVFRGTTFFVPSCRKTYIIIHTASSSSYTYVLPHNPTNIRLYVIGFLNPMQYMKMKRLPVKQFDLLPVTPVFAHRKNAAQRPGYYSDIIMHTDVELDTLY